MKKLLIDTNILIDLLAKRQPFFGDAAILFSMADRGEVQLSVSTLTITTTHYILARQLSPARARTVLRKVNVLVSMFELNVKIIELALNDRDFKDFEDAIQYYTAVEHGDNIIITRNLKDFRKSKLPVMTAAQFLATEL